MKSVDFSIQHRIFPNIYDDGWKFIVCVVVISLVLAMIWLPLGTIAFVFTLLCFYNFRDPDRVTTILSSAVVAPADGYVVAISKEKGPDAFGLQNKNFTRITIYSSIFDAHVNRIPIKGKINKIFYSAGKVFTGNLDKSCIGNEKMMFSLKNSEGLDFVLQQSAVFCNKRIITNIKSGDEFLAGNRFGFIRFGGYTDILLPDKVQPIVCLGQYMIAGETIIADIVSDAPRLEGEIR